MGAVRAVFDAGLRVPEDVAIIGIDDIEEGRYSRPSLSTVSLDTPFIARQAVARITARIADPDAPAVEIMAPHQVLARESTATSWRRDLSTVGDRRPPSRDAGGDVLPAAGSRGRSPPYGPTSRPAEPADHSSSSTAYW